MLMADVLANLGSFLLEKKDASIQLILAVQAIRARIHRPYSALAS